MSSAMGLVEIARGVAEQAAGGEEIEAYVVRSRTTEVRAHKGEVESFSQADSEGVGVRVLVDGRQGYAYCGSLEAADVAYALGEARDNAAFSQPDPALALARSDDCAGVEPAQLDLWRDEMTSVGPEEKIRIALDLEAATHRLDDRVRAVESADYGDNLVETAVANSHGVTATSRRTSCSCASHAIAGEGEATQTGYGFSLGRALSDLDVEATAREAVERSTRLLGARQIPTTRLPVILDPLVAHSFIGLLGTPLSGESLSRGRSFFADRVGAVVAAPELTLTDDPTDPTAYSAGAYDGEGVPTRRTELVVDGRLLGFAHNVVSARRVGNGARTTGAAVRGFTSPPGVGFRNLHATPGAKTLEELLAEAGDALYVQSVTGLHSGTNPISGDFSAGASGLRVRAGAMAEPVREVTIASTLQRMLLDIAAVGSEVRFLPGGASSPLLISEMTVGGS